MNLFTFIRVLPARWRLIWPLTKNDFQSRYASSQLGIFWAFFRPVLMAAVYIFVFTVIARPGPVGDQYPYALWMLPGLLVWFVFSDSLSAGTNTLTEYSYLVKNIRFSISILPDVKVAANFIAHTIFVTMIMLLYLIWGLPIKIFMLQLPYYYFATFCFTLALTRIISAIQPFFKDLSIAMELILMVGIWLCPIMWDIGLLSDNPALMTIVKANPMYYLVSGYRESFMGELWVWNHPVQTVGFWILTLVLDLGGRKLFRRLSPHFADVM